MNRMFDFTHVLLPEIIFLIVLILFYFKVKDKENKWLILGNSFFLVSLFYSFIICINGFNALANSSEEDKARIATEFLSYFMFINFWGILINLLLRIVTQINFWLNLKKS